MEKAALRILIVFLVLCTSSPLFAQNDFLAKQYFDDGAFDKAVVYYEKLTKSNARRMDYAEKLVECYRQLERYEDALAFLQEKLDQPSTFPTFYIEAGYTHDMLDQKEAAKQAYDKALAKVGEQPNYGYAIGYKFQQYALLDYALQAYATAMELNPKLDYNFQMARIYGEQGDIEKMYDSYLNLLVSGKSSQDRILRSIESFLDDNPENANNQKFKKVLLQRAQQSPDLLWNELLSWLFILQKQYDTAFRQEKAIYKRSGESSEARLMELAAIAQQGKAYDTALEVYTYVTENSQKPEVLLEAELQGIAIALQKPSNKIKKEVNERFNTLQQAYGQGPNTLSLQIAHAHFLAFQQDQTDQATALLKAYLEQTLPTRNAALAKMTLADILVYNQQFSQALIYYSQIQKALKNDVLGQNARFKVAQTSFYKGDFDWALTQLKILRGSNSQLIANDAMQLSLLISDNSLEDSTQTALKIYARADFLAFQQKDQEAIALLDEILTQHKGEKIEDEALMKQAQLLEKMGEYKKAQYNYTKIMTFFPSDILMDDALFAQAQLYENVFEEPDKAMELYEKILYNHQDSFYYPQARISFRRLRGDMVN